MTKNKDMTMTSEDLKKRVNAAVTPLEGTAGKYGDYAYVQINLSNGSKMMGIFALEVDIDFDSIAAQAKSAESEGRENTLFILSGTIIPEYAWEDVYSKGFEQNDCESIVIPQGVTKIGKYAFKGCTGLTIVDIPNSVTEIGKYAFSSCSSLISVEIPNSVTKIGTSAFEGCTGLTRVEIPNSVTEIGESAFDQCTSLTSVKIPNSVTEIGWSAFKGCTGLTRVEIPNSVTEIGDYAFLKCSKLTSVEIPDSVTEIGWGAFKGCTSLTSVKVPSSVIKIGYDTFQGCPTSVEIPDSVTIGEEDVLYFKNDDEFETFALDPMKVCSKIDKDGNEVHYMHREFSKRYYDAINSGKKFCICDLKSHVNKDGLLGTRWNTYKIPEKNIERYYGEDMSPLLKVLSKHKH